MRVVWLFTYIDGPLLNRGNADGLLQRRAASPTVTVAPQNHTGKRKAETVTRTVTDSESRNLALAGRKPTFWVHVRLCRRSPVPVAAVCSGQRLVEHSLFSRKGRAADDALEVAKLPCTRRSCPYISVRCAYASCRLPQQLLQVRRCRFSTTFWTSNLPQNRTNAHRRRP